MSKQIKLKSKLYLTSILLLVVKSIFGHQDNYWKPVDPSFDSIVSIMENLPLKAPSMQPLLSSLHDISLKTDNKVIQSRYLYWDIYTNEKLTYNFDSLVLDSFQKALHSIDSVEYEYDYARAKYLMINPVQNYESYSKQYETYLKLLSIFSKYSDLKYQGNVNRRLGILLSELEENEEALDYLLKANEFYKKLDRQDLIITNMVNISVVHTFLGNKSEAIKILENVLQKEETYLDTNILATIYTNLNNAEKDIEKKNDYAKKAYTLAQLFQKNNYLLNLTRINMGNTYLYNEQLDSALICFKSAYNFAVEHNTSRLLIPALLNISKTYEKMEKWDKAYQYYSEFNQVKDSIKGADKISEINKMQAGIAIKEYRNQLIIEQQKSELRRKQIIIIILVAIGLILSIFIILLFVWQKKKITDELLQKEELQNKNLQLEIDSQNRELSTTALILSEKNGIFNNLLLQMEKFRSKGEMSNPCELSLRTIVKDSLNSENEWASFKLHFEKVHPEFFRKFKEQYPSLTENDLRLCAYIQIGMSSKQISQMISVLPSTIKTNRYLLRKKLGLKPEESLDDFIKSF